MKEQFASTAPAATKHPATSWGAKQFAGKEQAPKAFSFVGAFIKYLRVKLLPRTVLVRDLGKALVQHLERNLGLAYSGKNKDESSHPLYLFRDRRTKKKCILKRLNPTDSEVKIYQEYLPLIRSQFPTLVLPEAIAVFNFGESAYVLLPYYEGEHFLHNSNDLQLATDLVNLALDLSTIDAALVLGDKHVFDGQYFESVFWRHFDRSEERRVGKEGRFR